MQCVASVFSLRAALCWPWDNCHTLCASASTPFPCFPAYRPSVWCRGMRHSWPKIIGQVFTRHSGNPPWGALHPWKIGFNVSAWSENWWWYIVAKTNIDQKDWWIRWQWSNEEDSSLSLARLLLSGIFMDCKLDSLLGAFVSRLLTLRSKGSKCRNKVLVDTNWRPPVLQMSDMCHKWCDGEN